MVIAAGNRLELSGQAVAARPALRNFLNEGCETLSRRELL
jgi:hypothetical protein